MSSAPPKTAADQHPTGVAAEEHLEHHHIHEQEQQKAPAAAASASYSKVYMIAIDHSPYAEHAFQWALNNLIHKDANELVVLTTVREPVLVPGAYGYLDFGDYIAEAEEQSRLRSHALIKKYGQQLLKHFGLTGASGQKLTVKGVVMRGDPRDEIVRKSAELKVNALVLGSRGLGTFKRAFLGSVSDFVVHHAEVPVIIVKSPEPTTSSSSSK
jgi:nucleotide-binding universal stress UspA family protein